MEKIQIEKQTAYMLIGLPGSGKSFLVNKLIELNPDLKVASSDYYVEKYAKEKKINYNQAYYELNNAQFKDLSKRIDSLLKEKESFIWDQVNLYSKARKKKIARLNSSKYSIVALWLNIPNNIIIERLKNREIKDNKRISPKVIEEMMNEYNEPSYDEGFDKIYEINEKLDINLLFKSTKLKIN